LLLHGLQQDLLLTLALPVLSLAALQLSQSALVLPDDLALFLGQLRVELPLLLL